jgi:hypothetical protein
MAELPTHYKGKIFFYLRCFCEIVKYNVVYIHVCNVVKPVFSHACKLGLQ